MSSINAETATRDELIAEACRLEWLATQLEQAEANLATLVTEANGLTGVAAMLAESQIGIARETKARLLQEAMAIGSDLRTIVSRLRSRAGELPKAKVQRVAPPRPPKANARRARKPLKTQTATWKPTTAARRLLGSAVVCAPDGRRTDGRLAARHYRNVAG